TATQTCTATFTVTASSAPTVTCAQNTTEAACQTQAAIDTKFAAWLNTFSTSGGCNTSVVRTPTTPSAPSFCGGSTTVTWVVSNSCTATQTCTATFTVTASSAPTVTCAQSTTTAACQTQAAVNTAFNNWLNTFSTSGGCNTSVVRTPTTPTAPSFCGGSTTVTWTVSNSCTATQTCTATCTVTGSSAPT